MGGQIAKYLKGEPPSLLMLGLDAAGKTTIMYKLRLGEVTTTIPTIGFNIESVESKMLKFTCFDMGGRCPMRPLWRHFYQGTDGIVIVVDSNDQDRLEDLHHEVLRLLGEDELKEKPVLFFANKQDLPHALSPEEVAERLKLSAIRDRPWHITGSVGTTGEGLVDGLEWISSVILTRKMSSKVTVPLMETVNDGKKMAATTGIMNKLKSLFM